MLDDSVAVATLPAQKLLFFNSAIGQSFHTSISNDSTKSPRLQIYIFPHNRSTIHFLFAGILRRKKQTAPRKFTASHM